MDFDIRRFIRVIHIDDFDVHIEDIIRNNPACFAPCRIGQSNGVVERTIRNCSYFYNTVDYPTLQKELQECFRYAIGVYCREMDINPPRLNDIEILKYDVGGMYTEHIDQDTHWSEGNIRMLSVICGLNDDYCGGEISFFNNTHRIRIKKGDILVFPSSFMFPHQVHSVVEGVRYTAVSWAVYDK
jgi:hypothetical protein